MHWDDVLEELEPGAIREMEQPDFDDPFVEAVVRRVCDEHDVASLIAVEDGWFVTGEYFVAFVDGEASRERLAALEVDLSSALDHPVHVRDERALRPLYYARTTIS